MRKQGMPPKAKRQRIAKKNRGFLALIARRLKVNRSLVTRVWNGETVSARVAVALHKKLAEFDRRERA